MEKLVSLLHRSLKIDTTWLMSRLEPMAQLPEGSQNGATVYGVFSESGNPFLLLASCSETCERSSVESSLKLLMEERESVEVAGIFDGSEAVFFRSNRYSGAFEYVARPSELISYSQLIGSKEYALPGHGRLGTTELQTVTASFERVLFEAHSALRDTDGLHPDEALDELCKLVYAKLFDEETAADNERSLRFQKFHYCGADETACEIRNLYQEACTHDMRVFNLRIPGYERSRGVFSERLRLSAASITEVVRIFESISFIEADADIKGRAFQKILGPTFRGSLGQYFTPEPIVKFLTTCISPTVNDLILDPFCGSGHFLSMCLKHVRNATRQPKTKLIPEFAFGKLHGLEISSRMVRVAMTDMRLQGDGHSNVRNTDALLPFQSYGDLGPETFDIVVTNPPFGSTLNADAISRLGNFDLSSTNKTPLEVLGLERSIQFLRPSGRIGIVLPASILTNRKAGHVREWLKDKIKLRAIISLPINAFAPLGASVQTCILIGRKWDIGEESLTSYPLWISDISSMSTDISEPDEFGEAQQAFNEFITNEGW